MDNKHLESRIFLQNIKKTFFVNYDLETLQDVNNTNTSIYKFKKEFFLENETPLNKMFINYYTQNSFSGLQTSSFFSESMNEDFSKFTQVAYCHTTSIKSFRCWLGINNLEVTNISLNNLNSARTVMRQNQKKSRQEYMLEKRLGLNYSNNQTTNTFKDFWGFGETLEPPMDANVNILDNMYRPFVAAINLGNFEGQLNCQYQRLHSIPLYLFDPFFDNEACLPNNLKITIEIELYRRAYVPQTTGDPRIIASVDGSSYWRQVFVDFIPIQGVSLTTTQYQLEPGFKNPLQRYNNIKINSKYLAYDFENAKSNIPTPIYLQNTFSNKTYFRKITFNQQTPQCIHFFIHNDVDVIGESTFQYSFYVKPTSISASINYYNFGNDINAGPSIQMLKIVYNNTRVLEFDNTTSSFLNNNNTPHINIMNNDFDKNYDNKPNSYYSKTQTSLNITNPCAYTFFTNPNKQSKNIVNKSELSEFEIFIEFQSNISVETEPNQFQNGPWNEVTLNKFQKLIYLFEFPQQFEINNNMHVERIIF